MNTILIQITLGIVIILVAVLAHRVSKLEDKFNKLTSKHSQLEQKVHKVSTKGQSTEGTKEEHGMDKAMNLFDKLKGY